MKGREPETEGFFPKEIKGFLAGIASGCTKLLVGHPFDTVKIRLQNEGTHGRFKGFLDCLKQTFIKEGIRGFYKGATPPLFGWALMDSVQLGSLTNFRLIMQRYNGGSELSLMQHGVSGLGAGWCVSLVATPVELVKAQLQLQYSSASKKYDGPLHCIKSLYNNRGLPGLWRGFSGCILFRSFFFVLWSSYEIYNRILKHMNTPAYLIPFLSGGLAANTFWTIAFPADVIKNRMMAQPDTTPLKYPNIRSCVSQIWRIDGIRGFYRGFLPCILRSFPTNGAALFVFDMVQKSL